MLSSEQKTLGDLVDYVLKHEHRKKAFIDWTEEQIANGILYASQHGELRYTVNDNGDVTGIVIADKKDDKLYILAILTSDRGSLKHFVAEYVRKYGYKPMLADRHGKPVEYNTPKLLTKLSTYGRSII